MSEYDEPEEEQKVMGSAQLHFELTAEGRVQFQLIQISGEDEDDTVSVSLMMEPSGFRIFMMNAILFNNSPEFQNALRIQFDLERSLG